MKDDIRKNGEGYVYITAYMALRNVIKEEIWMQYNTGDIIDIQTTQGDRTALIVTCNKDYATIGMLFDTPREHNNVTIPAKGIMYMDAGRLSYVYWDKVIGLVRTLRQIELINYMRKISEALGLDKYVSAKETAPELTTCEGILTSSEITEEFRKNVEDITECLRKDIREMVGNCVPPNTPIAQKARGDIIQLRAERDVYRGMCEKLMNSLTNREVNCEH